MRIFSGYTAPLGWLILLFWSAGAQGFDAGPGPWQAPLVSNQAAVQVQAAVQSVPGDDADGDGISDSVEGSGDSDGDGVPDYLDLDSDNDGIEDLIETAADLDADGVPNYLDLDSNGNGAFDYYESRETDLISYFSVTQLDSDSNGEIDASNVFGANGYADEFESPAESGMRNFSLADTDGDGVYDFLDLDSDNDGITNLEEKVYAYVGDGVVSTDKDLDSDNDAIFDVVEVYGISADQNRDGMLDTFVDTNGDGLSDQLPQGVHLDTDNDGKPDAYDYDSDGDGISDYFENWGYDVFEGGFIISSAFSGVAPQVWPLPNEIRDTDNDGIPDFRDTDSNNNSLSDLIESGAVDDDGDGFADAILNVSEIPDTDADGVADFQEYENLAGGSATMPEAGAAAAGGGGCVFNRKAKPDLTLLILMFISAVALHRRKKTDVKVNG